MYWLGEGADHIDGAVFGQLEDDSDRAVGIVAAAIVEQRLTEAIKARFVQNTTLLARMFDIGNGPLGTFGAKIDVGLLLGVLSAEGRNDLRAMKDIRNAFAHRLDVASFDHAKIKDRCLGMGLVEKHIGEPDAEDERRSKALMALPEGSPVPPELLTRRPDRPQFLFSGALIALRNPRRRYSLAAQVFSFQLGAGTHSEWPLPLL